MKQSELRMLSNIEVSYPPDLTIVNTVVESCNILRVMLTMDGLMTLVILITKDKQDSSSLL